MDYFCCSCSSHPLKGDFCAHIAALIYHILPQQKDESPSPLFWADRFDSSIWAILGKAFYETHKDKKIRHCPLEDGELISVATEDMSGKRKFLNVI